MRGALIFKFVELEVDAFLLIIKVIMVQTLLDLPTKYIRARHKMVGKVLLKFENGYVSVQVK